MKSTETPKSSKRSKGLRASVRASASDPLCLQHLFAANLRWSGWREAFPKRSLLTERRSTVLTSAPSSRGSGICYFKMCSVSLLLCKLTPVTCSIPR